MKQRNVLLEAALDYINRGIVVFPVKAGDKIPLTRNGFKAATVDDRTVCEWWKKWPDANIGIPTGRLSAFFVLDIDADKGGFESLKALEARYGVLPPTMESITGGGGRHKFFHFPRNMDIRNSVQMLGPGLDIRGNGGYVVAPPSIHSSGRQYQWLENGIDWPDRAPDWFLKLLTAKSNQQKPSKAAKANVTMEQLELAALCRGVKEGGRNNALARIAGGLFRFQRGYLDPELVLQLLLAWNDSRCQPPLSRDEVMRVVNSITGSELKKIHLKGR